jgi:large conductance mechanosensitive channel
MGFFKEFKEFAMKGNVMDMAIGIIIGGAFGKIISSLVTDVIMPPIGLLLGGIDFTKLVIKMGTATMTIGNFINAVIDFLIIALVIFLMIKGMNSMKKKEEAKPSSPPKVSEEIELLREIRDSLSKKK